MTRAYGSSSTPEGSSKVYLITLLGTLNSDWSDRLGGMNISADRDEDDRPVTLLQGKLRDQSALSGILIAVHDLHLPILKVERLKENQWKSAPPEIPNHGKGKADE